MGCTSSKESAPQESKRAILYGSDTKLPHQRYLADAPREHIKLDGSTSSRERRSGKEAQTKEIVRKPVGSKVTTAETARPKETFEAYAQRGVIRASALLPEGAPSGRTKRSPQTKRVGGYQKYMNE